MGKKLIMVTRIVVPVIIIIIVVPIFVNSASNLQQINQEKESSKQIFIPQFQNVLGNCTNTTGIGLSQCKEMISSLQSQCSFYDNPSICSDSRINQIMKSNAQTIIVTPSTSLVTYTNNQLGFSIDYPSNWVIDNNLPDGGIGLKDKMVAPNVSFEIKQMQNTSSSFDSVASTYVNQAGVAGYPITLQSKYKVTIGNKDAYKIQYTETIGSDTCKNEDYIINDGSFVPVISYNSCDNNLFSQFLPTYENVVSTFR
jgi:hypothetical protein